MTRSNKMTLSSKMTIISELTLKILANLKDLNLVALIIVLKVDGV